MLGDCGAIEGEREGDVRLWEALGARLGMLLLGVVRLGALMLGDLLGAGLLGVLLLGDLLGALGLGALLDGDEGRLGVVRLGDRETELEGLLDGAEDDLFEAEGLEEGLATGCAAAAGGVVTIGFETAGFGSGLTIGLGAAGFGVDLTTGLAASGFPVDLGVAAGVGVEGRRAAIAGVGFAVALISGIVTVGFGAILAIGSGATLTGPGSGASLGVAVMTGLGAGGVGIDGFGVAFTIGLEAAGLD